MNSKEKEYFTILKNSYKDKENNLKSANQNIKNLQMNLNEKYNFNINSESDKIKDNNLNLSNLQSKVVDKPN